MTNQFEKELIQRTEYLDYLRVFGIFAVMILHISAANWYITDVNRLDWQIFNFYDSIVRWCVPVFVMISGALFLSRDISIKKIYCKYVLRMVIAFCIWTGIYAIFSVRNHHMWFIPMIIGIYICIPLVKEIVAKEILIKYFLALSLLFAFIVPQIIILSNDFAGELIVQGISLINNHVVNDMNLHLVLGYVCYFILGYYLNNIQLSKKQRGLIYLLGIMGFILTIVLDLVVALKTQTCCDHYYGYFNVNVLLESVSVFVFFQYTQFAKQKTHNIIVVLSKYSFGAYLVHVLIMEWLDLHIGLNSFSFNSMISVPIIGIIVFVISFGISAILNHIPILNKYIV